jgi:D-apionolactonase
VAFETPIHLAAAALTAELVGPDLREVLVGGQRVLDSVYIAVRDLNWRTVPVAVIRQDVEFYDEGLQVGLGLRHQDLSVDFESSVIIAARAGSMRFEFVGEAKSEFGANRIGLCLIHPIELAGVLFNAQTGDGPVEVCFPEQISPMSLATNLTSLAYVTPEWLEIEIQFHGATFEMEDHRNWTDPGWKTFSLPPSPFSTGVHMRPGDRISQEMRLDWKMHSHGRLAATTGHEAAIDIRDREVGSVPEVALMTSPSTDLSVLRALHPATVHVEILESEDWKSELASVAGHSRALGIGLSATLVGSGPKWLAAVAEALSETGILLSRVAVIDPESQTTPAGSAPLLRSLMRESRGASKVGGGSRVHFAQLNRMTIPTGEWDYVTYPANPQAHHTGDASVMSTVLSLPSMVHQARAMSGGLHVSVGPVSIRQRLDPTLPAAATDPPDPREWNLLGAAWLTAAISAMYEASWLTVLWDLSKMLVNSAAFQALRTFIQLKGRPVLEVQYDPRRFSALAVRLDARTTRLIVANLTPETVEVQGAGIALTLPGYATETLSVDAAHGAK